MTKEREELKEKVKTLELEIKNEELEERIKQLQTETENLRYKLKRRDEPSFGSKAVDYIRKGVGSIGEGIKYIGGGIGNLIERFALPVVICGVVGGAGFGLYKGCNSCISASDEEKAEIKALPEKFINALNTKDPELIKESVICYTNTFRSTGEYNFIQTITEKVLREEYVLESLTFGENITSNNFGHPSVSGHVFDVEINASFKLNDHSLHSLSGIQTITCPNQCKFLIEKYDSRSCPPFSEKK